MYFLVSNLGYFNPFGDREGAHSPYNLAMWTLPVELKGSFLIYGLLFVLSLGTLSWFRRQSPTLLAMALLCGGVIILRPTADWSMVCFIWGLDSRWLHFLGRVSFSLYCTHLPWSRIFADRFKSAIGGYTDPALKNTIWDGT